MPGHVKKYLPDREYYFEEGCFILETANSEEDEAVSIAQARVQVGETTRWHCLRDTVERYVIIKGKGRVEIGQEAPCEVTPGDVVLIPPLTRQRITNHGDTDLVFLAVCSPRFSRNNYVALE